MLNLIWPRFFRTRAPEIGCNANSIRSTDYRDAEIKRLKDELGEADEEIVFKKDTIECQRREIESLRKQLAERHSDADYQAVRGDLSIVRQRVAKLRDDVSRAFRDFESVSPPEPQPPVVTVENFDVNSVPDDVLPVGWWIASDSWGTRWFRYPRLPAIVPTTLNMTVWTNHDGKDDTTGLDEHAHLFPSNITDYSLACWQKTKSATAVESPVVPSEPIPPNVYWSQRHANFYSSVGGRYGMGNHFYQKWEPRWDEFPTSPDEIIVPGHTVHDGKVIG